MASVHCRECGEMISESAPTCPKCGATQNVASVNEPENLDPIVGLNIVSFIWPLVGLILYIVYNDKSPQRAKACGKWALIGFVASIVVTVIILIVFCLSMKYYW